MSQLIDPSNQQEFNRLQSEGKQLAAEGRLKESLQKFELAKKICPTPKVLQRIEKLKEHLMIKNDSIYNNNLSATCKSNDLCSEGDGKVSPNLNSTDQNVLLSPKVLNDIQNVQKSSAPHTTSLSTDLTPISQSKFRELKKVAKESAYAGKYDEALEYFRKALTICDCPHVKRYIQEIQLVISNNYEEMQKTKDISDSEKKHEQSSNCVPESDKKNASSVQSLESSESDIEKKLKEVKLLYEEARDLAADGRLTNALKVLKKAQSIHETQKVQKRIDKLEELISTDLNDSESNKMIKITDDFSVFHDIYNKLYPYQREGVAWMWKLYKMGKGGVLGDDMGLGKTFQVIAFISGMIDANLVKHVLIIMPVSLLRNWENEFKKWCPGIVVHDFHGGSKKERERNLLRVQRRGHVLLTSYGMVVNNVESMIKMDEREFVWDYVILDEGHKIKNPTKTTKAVYEIPAKNRVVLTGTPIQNNLKELWSLYDFVQQGTLLGSLKTFKNQYENPITRSREKDATAGEKVLGTKIAENLKSLINPFFLRRTKDEIWTKENDDVEQLGDQLEKMLISRLTAKKNDLILWTYMSESQIEIYNSFLHSDAVKSILVSKRSPLVQLTTLKKICDHPRLLSQRACLQLGLNGELQNEDLLRELEDESTMASSIDNVSDETLLYESGKLKLVLQLLENLKESGHRTLVFSLSRKILDMIHRILVNRKWKVMRLDGTIAKTEERERRIQKFQNDASYPVFLLTTQVGGVGITLTAADRVIIYDPSWNPATDAQAVDRVYRIGQEKNVVVYRLITCGSVEEKIYRRQIFKDSITRQATGVTDPYRYFSKQELRELFSLDNPHYSATQVQLAEMHSSERHTDHLLDRHIQYLQTLNIFGISDHDLMFSKNIQDYSEDNDKAAISDNFIQKQVATAHELIKMEASVVAEGIRLARAYNRPYQETLPLSKKLVKDTYKPPILPDVIDLTESAHDACAFPSTKQTTSLETSNVPIKTHKPDQEIPVNENQYCFPPIQTKIESFFSIDEKEKGNSTISPKNLNSFSLKKILPDCKNDGMEESNGFNSVNTSCNVEQLRKSLDSIEPSPALQDNLVQEFIDEKENSSITNTTIDLEEEDSDDKDNKVNINVHSFSLKNEQNVCDELETLKLSHELEEKYHNLTQSMLDDLKDLSLASEMSERYVKGPRKSCARKSAFMISDSDASHQSSNESILNASVNLVDDTDDAASEACDSSNSSCVSLVPDSTPNTPDTVKQPQSVSETPPRVFCFEPELLPGNMSLKSDNSSFLRKFEGSVGGITPLKVDKNQTPQNSSFVQAMAKSLILTPYTSPEKSESGFTAPISTKSLTHDSLNNRSSVLSLDHDDDSPIKFKKKKPLRIYSDSEESDNEPENVMYLGLHPSEENYKNNSKDEQPFHSNHFNVKDLAVSECKHSSISDDDDDHINSEHPDQACEGEDHSDSKHSNQADEGEGHNDSEYSNQADEGEGHNDSEYSNQADQREGHSDSEYSDISEDDESKFVEISSSDESGSVFSQGDDSILMNDIDD